MSEYIVQHDTLVGIADAIREKTGTTDEMTLDGMVDVISSIETGSGGNSGLLDVLVDRTIVDFSSETVTRIGNSAFSWCAKLVTASIPNATALEGNAFANCQALTNVYAPKVTSLNGYAFNNCKAIERLCLESLQTISVSVFQNCISLKIADFPSLKNFSGGNVFKGCTALMTLIIRSSEMASLSTPTVFTDTPIESGTGYIYVPSALIEEYKVADNWSTYAAQFRALEDYTVDGTITGELDENKISAAA